MSIDDILKQTIEDIVNSGLTDGQKKFFLFRLQKIIYKEACSAHNTIISINTELEQKPGMTHRKRAGNIMEREAAAKYRKNTKLLAGILAKYCESIIAQMDSFEANDTNEMIDSLTSDCQCGESNTRIKLSKELRGFEAKNLSKKSRKARLKNCI